MTILLEKALQKVELLPESDQDAIASQILDSISDEKAWQQSFAHSPEKLERLAQEALAEAERGETRSLDELI